MEHRMDGKAAIVTGGARGLGRAYALRLASLGADVGIIDLDLKSYRQFEGEAKLLTAESTVDECKNLGVRSVGVEADITDKDSVFEAVRKIKEELGRIDVLICNAGGGMGAPDANKASEINWEQWDAVLNRNLYGTVYSCNAVAPIMKEQGSGKIITVISVGGLVANSDGSYAHYATAKAGIAHYTKLLAQELGRYNVTANAIAPGFIATGRLIENYKKAGEETFLRNVAMKRFGTTEECANVIEFLSTELSDYVNGAVIEVTGGTVGRMIMNEPCI